MALKKSLEINNSGVNGEYIRLDNIKFHEGEDLLIMLEIFGNQALREQGKKPLTPFSIHLKDAELINEIKQLVYNKLKGLEPFEGATDV